MLPLPRFPFTNSPGSSLTQSGPFIPPVGTLWQGCPLTSYPTGHSPKANPRLRRALPQLPMQRG